MPIAYPVNLPSAFKVKEIGFDAMSSSGVSSSPFSGEEQIYVHQGEWFEFEVSCPPAKRDIAEEVVAFLLSLNGREGSFLCPPPGYTAGARGSLAGVPLVNAASQTGKTLATDGWTAGAANVLKAGDWFQLGAAGTSRLYKLVQAASANGAGQANLEIWPRLKESPADNAALTVVSPKGCFRLSDARTHWDIGEALVYGISFRVREAF